MKHLVLFLILIITLLPACKDRGVEPPIENPTSQVSITGTWGGTRDNVLLTIYITEASDTVSGTAVAIVGNKTFPVRIAGSHRDPEVVLMMYSYQYGESKFIGSMQGDRMVLGILHGFGHQDLTYEFVKYSDHLFKRSESSIAGIPLHQSH